MKKFYIALVLVLTSTVYTAIAMKAVERKRTIQQPEIGVQSLLQQIERAAVSQGNQEAARAYLAELSAGIEKIQAGTSLRSLPATEKVQRQFFLKEASDRVKKVLRESRGIWTHDKLIKSAKKGVLPGGITQSDYQAYMQLYRPLPKGPVDRKQQELTRQLVAALKPIYEAMLALENADQANALLTITFNMAIKNLGALATPEMKSMIEPVELQEQAGSVKLKAQSLAPQLQAVLKSIVQAGNKYKFEQIFEDATAHSELEQVSLKLVEKGHM